MALYIYVACSKAHRQLLQVQQIIIFKKIMRRLFIRYVNGGHIIWLHSISSNTQFIRNYSPQSGACLQMTGAHNLFLLYALVICDHSPPVQGYVKDLNFISAVPHSNHHTVGTASWQNHDSSPPQSVILLHCRVCLCLSNTYISSATSIIFIG